MNRSRSARAARRAPHCFALLLCIAAASGRAEGLCEDGTGWLTAFSGPLYNISKEGDPYRLAVGRCFGRLFGVPVHLDGVVSRIAVNTEGGVPGGDTWAFAIEPVMQRSFSRLGYWEFGGGLQATTSVNFPANGSRVNFTLFLGSGLRFRLAGDSHLQLGLRLFHVSNANLLPDNSGYDGVLGLLQVDF